MTPQTSVNPEEISRALSEAGFQLHDFGDHWRSNAIFRNGDNPTAIKIYKNSGVWFDYTVSSVPQPFNRLLQLSIPDKQKLKSLLIGASSEEDSSPVKIQLSMEKIYPESVLQKLFPNFSFYLKKGYSEETMRFYKAGLAGEGKMYRRTVFPIYDALGQIVGFSGRKVSDENPDIPKWKHLGKKRNWIYPAFIPNDPTVNDIIQSTKEVVLVESIGDSLALHQSGIKNNLVTFGLGCSPAIINYLSSFEIKRIIMAPNNDLGASKNHGYNASISALRMLAAYFNLGALEIRKPPAGWNDLSKAFEEGENLQEWYNKKEETDWLKEAYSYAFSNQQHFQTKDLNFLKESKYHARA